MGAPSARSSAITDLVAAVFFAFLASIFAYGARVIFDDVRHPGLFAGPADRLGSIGIFLACAALCVACLAAVSQAIAPAAGGP